MTAAVEVQPSGGQQDTWFVVQVLQLRPARVPLRTFEDMADRAVALATFDHELGVFRRDVESGRVQVRVAVTDRHRDLYDGPVAVHPVPLPAGSPLADDELRRYGVGSV